MERKAVPSERDEVTRAARDLALTGAQFRVVREDLAGPILQRIEARFVARAGLRWWWEAFRVSPIARAHFPEGTGWAYLTRIVPPGTGTVWFVVEGSPEFTLCEGTIEAVQSVIGECRSFEYYVVSQQLDWLVCENHSDVMCAVGEPVAQGLARAAAS